MSSRKTVSVLSLLEQANKRLAVVSPHDSDALGRAYRHGICSFIERILHDSGNYAGFGYLDSPYVAGVTDESRRSYYYSPAMRKAARETIMEGSGA
jgi:hypothetical protein